jgi:hypothetical protein
MGGHATTAAALLADAHRNSSTGSLAALLEAEDALRAASSSPIPTGSAPPSAGVPAAGATAVVLSLAPAPPTGTLLAESPAAASAAPGSPAPSPVQGGAGRSGLISSSASPVAVTPLPAHSTPECDLPAQLARYLGLMRGRDDVVALASADVGRTHAGAAARSLHRKHQAAPPAVEQTLRVARELATLLCYVGWEDEVAWLVGVCQRLAGPVVLTHGDLQEGNWIASEDGKDLYLIDYEYACYNHRGQDLGNLFCEHTADYSVPVAPGFHLDPFAYPTGAWQARFLHAYASEGGLFTDSDVTASPVQLGRSPGIAMGGGGAAVPAVAAAASSGAGVSATVAAPASPPAGDAGSLSGKPPRRKSALSRASSGSSLKAMVTSDGGAGVPVGAPPSPPALMPAAPEPVLLDLTTSMWLRTSASEAALTASMPSAGPVVRKLAQEARVGLLASHLYWSLWSAVMAAGKAPVSVAAVDAARSWLDAVAAAVHAASTAGASAAAASPASEGGGDGGVAVTPVMSGHSVFSYAAYGLARAAEYVRLKAQLLRDGVAAL